MGQCLMLPAFLAADPRTWMPRSPLTLRAYVQSIIDHLAESQGSFTTAQVRAAILADVENGTPVAVSRWQMNLNHPMAVVSQLQRASAGRDAYIVKVSGARAAWRRTSDASVTDRFALDTDRVVEAARRSVSRSGRSSFTYTEVDTEISLDFALEPTGKSTARQVLSELAKERLDDGEGGRKLRRRQHVVRLGALADIAHYWVDQGPGGPSLDQAKLCFANESVLSEIQMANVPARTRKLDACQSSVLRDQRAHALLSESSALLKKALRLGEDARSNECVVALLGANERLASGLRFRRGGEPAEGVGSDYLMEPLAVRDLIGPFSTAAARMTTSQQIVRHFFRCIRRVRNPHFENRRALHHRNAAQFLFDGVSARLYLANQWGGATARLMAGYAEAELGDCRSAPSVLRALSTAQPELKVRVIAAAAFLGSASLAESVGDIALNHVDAGCRVAALWASGVLLDDERSGSLVSNCLLQDSSPIVKRFAREFLTNGVGWAWKS